MKHTFSSTPGLIGAIVLLALSACAPGPLPWNATESTGPANTPQPFTVPMPVLDTPMPRIVAVEETKAPVEIGLMKPGQACVFDDGQYAVVNEEGNLELIIPDVGYETVNWIQNSVEWKGVHFKFAYEGDAWAVSMLEGYTPCVIGQGP